MPTAHRRVERQLPQRNLTPIRASGATVQEKTSPTRRFLPHPHLWKGVAAAPAFARCASPGRCSNSVSLIGTPRSGEHCRIGSGARFRGRPLAVEPPRSNSRLIVLSGACAHSARERRKTPFSGWERWGRRRAQGASG